MLDSIGIFYYVLELSKHKLRADEMLLYKRAFCHSRRELSKGFNIASFSLVMIFNIVEAKELKASTGSAAGSQLSRK